MDRCILKNTCNIEECIFENFAKVDKWNFASYQAKSAVIQHHIEILSFASLRNHPAEILRNSLDPVEQARTRDSKFKNVVDTIECCKIQRITTRDLAWVRLSDLLRQKLRVKLD